MRAPKPIIFLSCLLFLLLGGYNCHYIHCISQDLVDTLQGVTAILLVWGEYIPRVGFMVFLGYEDLTKADGIVWDTGVFFGEKRDR